VTTRRVIDAEVIDDRPEQLRKVSGADGKTYTVPPRDVPPPRRRRRPLPDAFEDATFELDVVVRRIERLTDDDRFPAHAAALRGGRPGMYLDRAHQCIQRMRDALANEGVPPRQDDAVPAAVVGGEDR
jgi:hypothetical protein